MSTVCMSVREPQAPKQLRMGDASSRAPALLLRGSPSSLAESASRAPQQQPVAPGAELPYMKMDVKVKSSPRRDQGEGYCPKMGMAARTVQMTESALAKFFRMLSAYLTTMPTTMPPKACSAMANQVYTLNPWKKPPSSSSARSDVSSDATASGRPYIDSWQLRIQSELVSAPFTYFSNQTPAKAEEMPDTRQAMTPRCQSVLLLGWLTEEEEPVTRDTPPASTGSDIH
mmetsp:Transcript_9409/g.23974  ORF Transcript_9409/g.23974 Transcript_9409/m.23974 type:complete len:229 (-) Transcript_9409:562-1248(-)